MLDVGIVHSTKATGKDQLMATTHCELSRGLNGNVENTGVSGTLPYMSFRQWDLSEINHYVDSLAVGAVGITLWATFTESQPLGENIVETLMASVATIESRLLSRTGVTPQLAKTWIENVDRQMGKEKNSRSHKTTEQLAAFK